MINVIICSHNRSALLESILKSLEKQSVQPRVWIVDDSDNADLSGLQDYSIVHWFSWHRPDGLYHRVAKYNEAMKLIGRGKIVLLDDDCPPVGTRYVEAFETLLQEARAVRGLFLDTDGQNKLTPWFSTTNLGLREPRLFDPIFDGRYGYEDLDLERTLEFEGVRWVEGSADTAVQHVGPSFSGDRVATQINESHYRDKWGLKK